ncbi:MAG: ATP phosphoribosyltransferase regulatory subunit [Actinobacteria bacterium]|nr:ATP phosphoribosyltransferase regulatory subunit [Actinomycetota bacterium]
MADPVPLPAGVRDVLPVEAAELRALGDALAGAFASFGFRDVMTPLIELADVLDRAEEDGVGRAYRLFDDEGRVLVLRPDLTIPTARLVATRMADHPDPVRVSYNARAVRPPVPGRIEGAEQRQAGIELVGLGGPEADAEVIAALATGLAAAGVPDARIAVGSVALVSAVIEGVGAGSAAQQGMWAALRGRSLVDWRDAATGAGADGEAAALLAELPSLRGGQEVLDRVSGAVPGAADECARLAAVLELVAVHGVAPPMVDLGVVRDWAYYSGVVIEAYAAGAVAPVAVGGRYDGLAARFGRSRPAVGVAVALDLLHHAVGRGAEQPDAGIVLVGGCDEFVAQAAALRAGGVAVVALPSGATDAEAVALADGRRFVVRRDGAVWMARDVIGGAEVPVPDLGEGPWS